MTTSQAIDPAPDQPTRTPQPGDWIEVNASEGSARRGVILEILGEGPHTHFRVRWDEEHVSLFYPAHGGFLVHSKTSKTVSDR